MSSGAVPVVTLAAVLDRLSAPSGKASESGSLSTDGSS